MGSNGEVEVGDAVSAELTALLTRLTELADAPTEHTAVPDAARIDRIAVLERMRAALAAAQHTEMVAFGRSQVAAHTEQITGGTLDPRKLGQGIADQIASPPTSHRSPGPAGSGWPAPWPPTSPRPGHCSRPGGSANSSPRRP
ncbi:hypothetical protein [Actinomycetospora sp.]|jgi:hypothetical protein|uniref:hypothetical protein n=1 Tax=Actinomycetospora sp. TaxID=1872135 RepID=UPI002F41136F